LLIFSIGKLFNKTSLNFEATSSHVVRSLPIFVQRGDTKLSTVFVRSRSMTAQAGKLSKQLAASG
jgi:hypothetical protein